MNQWGLHPRQRSGRYGNLAPAGPALKLTHPETYLLTNSLILSSRAEETVGKSTQGIWGGTILSNSKVRTREEGVGATFSRD